MGRVICHMLCVVCCVSLRDAPEKICSFNGGNFQTGSDNIADDIELG